jgi:predicted nucleotidyltransferase component of viral defense system
MIIPLEKRLRKRMHVETALLQDEAMEILYGIDNGLVFHGGTALWRCYGGNRFSEDLDLYCGDIGKIEREFRKKAAERGLSVLKFKKTANLVFCKVSNGRTEMRIELNHSARKSAIVRPYEKTDGSFMDVLTLSPEDLLMEKIEAYRNRRFIRDIYDVYHLSNYVKDEKTVKKSVLGLLESLTPPVDVENLKAIVYAGNIPSFEQIVEALKRRFS